MIQHTLIINSKITLKNNEYHLNNLLINVIILLRGRGRQQKGGINNDNKSRGSTI